MLEKHKKAEKAVVKSSKKKEVGKRILMLAGQGRAAKKEIVLAAPDGSCETQKVRVVVSAFHNAGT